MTAFGAVARAGRRLHGLIDRLSHTIRYRMPVAGHIEVDSRFLGDGVRQVDRQACENDLQ